MSSTANIRFVCRVVRFQIALSGHAGKTSRHVAHCPDCQTYFQANDALMSALRRDASQETQSAPDDLAAKIARAVRQSAPRPQRSSYTAAWSTLAGAAAVIALSIIVVRQNSPIHPVSPKNQTTAEIHPADVAKLVANVDSLRIRLLDSVEPTAEKIATQNPLTQELNSVQADARSALSFLALNFLPADSAHQLKSGADTTRS